MFRLKINSLKAFAPFILVFWGLSALTGYMAVPALYTAYFTEPTPWDSVDFGSDIEGLYVKATLYGIYDWYCEETTDNVRTAREYIMDADDYYFIGLRANNAEIVAADTLLYASHAFLNEEDDGTLLEQAQYEVTGVIKPIPSGSLAFYHEYLDWDNLSEEERSVFLPYYLEINSLGSCDLDSAIGMAVICIACFLVGCIPIFRVLTGKYQKAVNTYISCNISPDNARERVAHFLKTTPETDRIRYNREFICGCYNGTIAFGEMSRLTWISITTASKDPFPSYYFKPYSLELGFADGTKQLARVRNEKSARKHMQKIIELCPNKVSGYNSELKKVFQRDLSNLPHDNIKQ